MSLSELEQLKQQLQAANATIKSQQHIISHQKEILTQIGKEVHSLESQLQAESLDKNHQQTEEKIKASLTGINKLLVNKEGMLKTSFSRIDYELIMTENESESKDDPQAGITRRSRTSSSIIYDVVAILDGGAQYAKVIDRRVRECNVQSVIVPFTTKWEDLRKYKAIIISGGPSSVYANDSPKCDVRIFKENKTIPILGICYGFQLMAYTLEGKVERGEEREDGQFLLQLAHDKSLLFDTLLTHGDMVVNPGKSFIVTSKSSNKIISSAEHESLPFYGVQFHPEVDLTTFGPQIFTNFLFKIANCKPSFTVRNRKDAAIEFLSSFIYLLFVQWTMSIRLCYSYILDCVEDKKVLSLISGGVDSSVCTALLRQALNPKQVLLLFNSLFAVTLHTFHTLQIYCVHVDTGFMRKNESAQVKKALEDIGVDVHVVDASEMFYNGTTIIDGAETKKLKECTNPEHKRKIIGDIFMRLCEDVVRNTFGLKFDEMMLAQGTLRPDLIESASQHANKGNTADVIKTHHNDTFLVRQLRASGRVVEPLSDYHKDEVRILGAELGLPKHLVWRQPFPGPGLAIRIICATEPYLTEHDQTILYAIHLLKQLKQFETDVFAVSGSTTDKKPWDDLYKLAKDIPRVVRQVNRCVFLFGHALSGHQSSITKTLLIPDVINQLRECDDIVNQLLLSNDLLHTIAQVPVVLFPSNFGVEGARSICIRPFISRDFMTGVPAVIDTHLPEKILNEMVTRILQVKGIARVALDLTPKPPGTTEWE
ncbi:hypothetical protein RFI_26859 [Reticulomyxa filosa]|uniref:GMP synthase (glutamine-hydrolyzing) n=1 Tax=Reticulomyxa filosa TaxID=46433 RepID=X6MBU1_RETFI|nr:hypothetical protein RFI_26859 [Reticulomyxa filosa]|eukprot:ETO10515.1 hypothetical protein RFI_26859 [Reticulomyxa filosa]